MCVMHIQLHEETHLEIVLKQRIHIQDVITFVAWQTKNGFMRREMF
jgi:hypothetical protein